MRRSLFPWLVVRPVLAVAARPALRTRSPAAQPPFLPVHDSGPFALCRLRPRRRPSQKSPAHRCGVGACRVPPKGLAALDELHRLIRNGGAETACPPRAAGSRLRSPEPLSRAGAFEIRKQVSLPDEAHATAR